ncbi:cyclophilin-like fold protein [Chloroflexota bacterium]
MTRQIRIKSGSVVASAELHNTKTADAIWQALPLTGNANRWGEEIYFDIPVKIESEDGQQLVDSGDLGYWPPGSAFCIFFGPTPMSRGDEIRAASPVNVFGKLVDDPKVFSQVKDGEKIVIERF